MEHTPLTPAQAWADFWKNFRPSIWKGLTQKQKGDLYSANRAATGKERYGLGLKRQQRIFEAHAPGRYVAETKTVFYLTI